MSSSALTTVPPAEPAQPAEPVTLDNCEREPIHIPGQTQPHGALLAFDLNGTLTYCSANAQTLLGPGVPALNERLDSHHFPGYAGFHELLSQVRNAADVQFIPHALTIQRQGHSFDVIAQRTGQGLICEFEQTLAAAPAPDNFSFMLHRAIARLKQPRTAQELLAIAVEEVRRMTGFDRVMAYRFRHDDSGDVVAESADPALKPYIGMRYPASDIPAQARRLYVINTLRLIADVRARPVPVVGLPGASEPLDMSYCVLRSVSPVHIEYLSNIGVGASMSVSIVIGNKLWGMLACHHRQPRHVPYNVRLACDVLAQILASGIQGALAKAHAVRTDAAATLRSRLVEQVLHAEDLILALSAEAAALCESVGAHGVVVADGARLQVHGGVPLSAGAALLQWLNGSGLPSDRIHHLDTLETLPPALRTQLGVWCSLLALPFGAETSCWVVLLRKEQLETISWGGKPEKELVTGPFGPRLTPRGSFDLWRETVGGKAVPWDAIDLESAQKLFDELHRADAAHMAGVSRARSHLMAMLGHDLRDPLQGITYAAALLKKTGGDSKVSQFLQNSSRRMQRLVDQVMDMSQLQSGSMSFNIRPVDLAEVFKQMVQESQAAHPGLAIAATVPLHLVADADADRIAQVLSNLLSNASHHGAPGEPVRVDLFEANDQVTLQVSNTAGPIAPMQAASLFQPFKRTAVRSGTNRNGLGLGLYIAHQVMAGHGGQLTYRYAEPCVVFTATFPARCAPA
ncbi:MAG: hypothetical protein JWR60_1897 [Polaromonas sp.]|nr:hypothetical protein [Polaromonas sp.]